MTIPLRYLRSAGLATPALSPAPKPSFESGASGQPRYGSFVYTISILKQMAKQECETKAAEGKGGEQ